MKEVLELCLEFRKERGEEIYTSLRGHVSARGNPVSSTGLLRYARNDRLSGGDRRVLLTWIIFKEFRR